MSAAKTNPVSTTEAELPIGGETRRLVESDIAVQTPVSVLNETDFLRVEGLKMHFPVMKGLLKRQIGSVKAVDDISFTIPKGKTLGIVGESGSGKSTLGNCVARNLHHTAGRIILDGTDISSMRGRELKELSRKLTMITQDPFTSLDPRMTVRDSILEGVQIHNLVKGRQAQNDLVEKFMRLVGLNPEFAARFPHEFSGGQRQRISIARALAVRPQFVVCDEIVSALDVSIQAQIVGLMMNLQEQLGLTYIFIGHDLSVVRHISDQVAVMYLGKIMEMTSSEELYKKPLHSYTKALISAAPIPQPKVDRARERILLEGEIPSPLNPPIGCHFCTRCRNADSRCREVEPALSDAGGGHLVACHRVQGS